MKPVISAVAFVLATGFLTTTTSAEEPNKVQLMNAARNVCAGVIAKFADTPDPQGEVSYDQGKFKVVRAKNSVTVLEDNVPLAKMEKFNYSDYQDCLNRMIGDKK